MPDRPYQPPLHCPQSHGASSSNSCYRISYSIIGCHYTSWVWEAYLLGQTVQESKNIIRKFQRINNIMERMEPYVLDYSPKCFERHITLMLLLLCGGARNSITSIGLVSTNRFAISLIDGGRAIFSNAIAKKLSIMLIWAMGKGWKKIYGSLFPKQMV